MGRGSAGSRVRLAFLLQPPWPVQWSALQAAYSSVSLLLLPQLVNLGHSCAGQNSGDDQEECLQYQRHCSGRGKKAQSTATARKRQWEMGLLYIWLKTFPDELKNPTETTKSLPCYTHTFTEQEQYISSQITLQRGISIPWHHSLSWDLRPEHMTPNTSQQLV